MVSWLVPEHMLLGHVPLLKPVAPNGVAGPFQDYICGAALGLVGFVIGKMNERVKLLRVRSPKS
jgi:hypothetical protein